MTGARDRTPGRRLCCACCGAFIAERDAASVVNGAHRHVGTNPHGLTFEIGCFEPAPGCLSQGPPDDRWSWFPGYRWQVGLCRTCGTHLGWYYRGGSRAFYGLILGQLRACSEGGDDRF